MGGFRVSAMLSEGCGEGERRRKEERVRRKKEKERVREEERVSGEERRAGGNRKHGLEQHGFFYKERNF